MIPISATEVGVENESELRSAVSSGSYNYIYLVNDIAMLSAITIDPSKTSLVIDGEWPQESGILHTFTDMNSTSYLSTIGIRGTSSIAITLRNMEISGHNYFGVPYIIENTWLVADTTNVSVTYENVRYIGPQITYNRNGLTRYIDCDITITQTGASQSEEVAEVNRVEIGGRTTIRHTSSNAYAVFWFNNTTSTSSLTILPDAEVTIRSENSYFMYNRDFSGTLAPVTYTVQSGAKILIEVYRGIAYNQNHPVSAFRVNENATFYYIQATSNGTSATLYLDGALEVGPGAHFYMQASAGTQPLIRFTTSASPSLNVSNAHSFVLYSPNTAALSAQGTVPFTLGGGQLNTWTTAITPVESAGGFNDLPQHRWFKLNYALPVAFSGTFTQTITAATGNMTTEDEPHPADTDLQLQSARVISLGDWDILPDPVVNDGRPITGLTDPYANLIATYEIEETEHEIADAADADGRFTISTEAEEPPTIAVGTVVTIDSNIPFLIKRITTVAVAAELSIQSAPGMIIFRPRPISFDPPLLPRVTPEEPVIITDYRAGDTQWALYASVTGPLQTICGKVLRDAVVFVANEGESPITLNGTPQLVFTGGPGIPTTRVFWPVRAGILVRVTDPVHSGLAYTTNIVWDLRPL